MIKFRKFISKENNKKLICALDKRSNLYLNLQNNKEVQIAWFFHLSREKYRIKSYVEFVDDNKVRNEIWEEEIDKEEKKTFNQIHPDTFKPFEKEKMFDTDKFNTPDKIFVSENFAVIGFLPFEGIFNCI